MDSSTTLERRIQRLEDLEAIRQLKARYFLSCDRKDPTGMRGCFVDGKVEIDFGVVGAFDEADKLVEVFKSVGCHEHMVELHHGMNPVIEIVGEDEARGSWSLHYFLIDTQNQSGTQLAGQYEDRYRRVDGHWKISASCFTATSTLALSLSQQQVGVLFAGRTPPLVDA